MPRRRGGTLVVGVGIERVGAHTVNEFVVRGEMKAVTDVEAAADLSGRGDLRAS